MFRTWRTRKRRHSNRRSAQADMGRCVCAPAGQASRHIRAERVRTGNRSQSGFVPVAAEPPLWTDSSGAGTGFARGGHERNGSKRERGAIIMAPRSGPDCSAEWPREESNLRARIRSPSLYPLSYGAVRRSVASYKARSSRPNHRREGGLCPPSPLSLSEGAIPTKVMRRRRDFRR